MLQRTLRSFRRYLLDRLVLRPTQHPIQVSHQDRVILQCELYEIECFVQQSHPDPDPPDLLILKFPGTAGRAERSTSFPTSILDVPRTAMWTWNPPGYGGSGGRASLSNMATAGVAFWKKITDEQVGPETTVWLCGNSLGCTTALHIAATAKPDQSRTGLILRNPPPLRRVVKHAAQPYPHLGLINRVIADLSDSMDAMLTASQVDLHAVILQSELDTLVPIEFQNELLDVYAGQYRTVLMEGLDHDDLTTDQHETPINDSIRWLWEHTGSNKHELSSK